MCKRGLRADSWIVVKHNVDCAREDWIIPEFTVPESQPHDLALDLLKAILVQWVKDKGRNAQVARNLAVRFYEEKPSIGVDPDLCVIEPSAPDGNFLSSLCLWKEGHEPPVLAVEVVSEGHPFKDYTLAPEKYAYCGVQELWIFDPLMVGPKRLGGPWAIQVWRRQQTGAFERVYAGEGPAYSEVVDGWLFAVSDGHKLRIASEETGENFWLTPAEKERAEKEKERAE